MHGRALPARSNHSPGYQSFAQVLQALGLEFRVSGSEFGVGFVRLHILMISFPLPYVYLHPGGPQPSCRYKATDFFEPTNKNKTMQKL